MPDQRLVVHVVVLMLALTGASASLEASTCSTWEWINPLPQGNRLLGVAHGTGTWVAVGEHGTVVTTADGSNGVVRATGTTDQLRGVVWTGDQFIVVGRSILTSPDGLTWTVQVTGTNLSRVAWGNGLAAAVGTNGEIVTSPDGVNWTTQVSGTTATLWGATWGNGQFVVVGSASAAGVILTSPDGVVWTPQTSGTRNGLFGVTWSGTRFIAVGRTDYGEDPSIVSSPDGVAWSGETSSTGFGLMDVTWTGTQFVAVGLYNVITSPDGITWTTRVATFLAVNAVANAPGGALMTVGDRGRIMTSADGITWTDHVFETELSTVDGIAFSGSDFVAACRYILHSPDGYVWSVAETPTSTVFGVAWDGSRWVVVGGEGLVLSSPDGTTWTVETSATSEPLYAVTYESGLFVAVGYNGTIVTSPDGMSWTARTSGVSEWLLGITSNGAQYIVLGDDGTLLTSPDGVTWTERSPGTDRDLKDGCWTGSLFVVVGQSGTIITSADGSSWDDHSLGIGTSLYAVAWNGAELTALSLSGRVFTSPDAIAWTEESSPTNNQMRAAVAVGSDLWVGGNQSMILHRSEGGCDYGDAPDPAYPTLRASNGARHVLSGLWLGAGVDAEPDGQPTSASDGDDLAGVDDEDGVDLPSSLLAGAVESVDVTASAAGLLSAWIDFDSDGNWFDAGEQVFADQPLVAGVNTLPIPVPLDAVAGATAARFRFSSASELAPTGPALDGEVEDHAITVDPSAELELTVSDDPDPVPDGDAVTYFLRLVNNGTLEATGVTLSNTLPAGVVFAGSVPGSPTCTEAAGVVTCDLGTAPAGGWTMVKVTVDVTSGASEVLTNTATVTINEEDPIPTNNSAIEDTAVVDVEDHVFSGGFETGDFGDWQVVTGGEPKDLSAPRRTRGGAPDLP